MPSETPVTLSAEKQFMFRDAHNRGFIQLPRMVVSCFGLSVQAKGVYSFITNYVYEQGRPSFPSVRRIATACGLTAKSVTKYINELEEMGFIRKIRRGRGKTNIYYLADTHEVGLLKASEVLWKAVDGAKNRTGGKHEDKVYEALETILETFKEHGVPLTVINETPNAKDKIEDDIVTMVKGGEPSMIYVPRVNKTRTAGDVGVKSGRTFLDKDIDKWRNDDFRNYFYRKYFELVNAPHHVSITVHRAIISRMLKKLDGDKDRMKKFIDAFFEIGYENKSLENFGASARFPEIELYLSEGKKPYYIEKGASKKSVPTEQEYKGIDEDEFIKRIKGEKE